MSDKAPSQPTEGVTPTRPEGGPDKPGTAPATPVDTQAQEEAGKERAEDGGYN